MRQSLTLTATQSGTQVALSWPDVTEADWPGSPQISYVLYRDGEAVAGYDGSSRPYTDTSAFAGQRHAYRVALLVDGLEVRRSNEASLFVDATRTDADSDGLIDISNLAQLNAVRWDLDSNGLADDVANNPGYNAAFPVPASGSFCKAGGQGEGACVGYELTADLDFDENDDGEITAADPTYWNGGSGWQPIGNNRARFTGVFDGGGHAIASLRVNRPSTDYIGLFGYIGSGGEVRNLGLPGVDVTGDEYVGGLAGYSSGTISGSYAAGTVSGRYYVGGLAGYNYSGAISGSYAAGTVSGDYQVGGLAGNNRSGTISGSYAAGTVSGNSSVGGAGGL